MKGILWAVIDNTDSLCCDRRYPCGAPHHITLQFDVERSNVEEWIGQMFYFETLADCWNDRIQAIAVRIPERIPCSIENPHITVSWIDGAKPFESNAMMAGDRKSETQNMGHVTVATIDFFEFGNA